MPAVCIVPTCKNRFTDKENYIETLSFHTLPKQTYIRKLWLERLGLESTGIPENARICSLHFEEESFNRNGCRTRLLSYALPSPVATTSKKIDTKDASTSMGPLFLYNCPDRVRLRKRIEFLIEDHRKEKRKLQCKLGSKKKQLIKLQYIIDDLKKKYKLKSSQMKKSDVLESSVLEYIEKQSPMNLNNISRPLTMLNLKKICRLCLSENKNLPLFEDSIKNTLKPAELIEYCLSIKVDIHDNLPKHICKNCIQIVFNYYKFKNKCLENIANLKQFLENYEKNNKQLIYNLEDSNSDDEEKNLILKNDNNTINNDLISEENIIFTVDDCEENQIDNLDNEENQIDEIENKNYDDLINTENNQVILIEDYSDSIIDNEELLTNDEETCVFTTISNDEQIKLMKSNNNLKQYLEPKKIILENIKKFRKSCRDCPEIFTSKEEFLRHRQLTKHCKVILQKHPCPVCAKMFPKGKMNCHMRTHTKEKPYSCDICSQRFTLTSNLRRHLLIHSNERRYVCEKCGKGFIQSNSLKAHQKVHQNKNDDENQSLLECGICGRSFKRDVNYLRHLKRHNPDYKFPFEIRKQNDHERPHICDICNRKYRSESLLKRHKKIIHGEKKFLCTHCGKNFVTKMALEVHNRTHTGERPYTCSVCNKSFSYMNSLDAHVLIHTGQRPYKCTYCQKTFIQSNHLKYHLRIHNGERPYSCTFCNKTFAVKGNLTVHIRTHTGETPYTCEICGKGFYDSSSRNKHKRKHNEHIELTIDEDFSTMLNNNEENVVYLTIPDQ